MAFMAAAIAMNGRYDLPIRKPIPKAEKVAKPQKGHKEFFYGENTIWALNQTNADRKAKQLGYI